MSGTSGTRAVRAFLSAIILLAACAPVTGPSRPEGPRDVSPPLPPTAVRASPLPSDPFPEVRALWVVRTTLVHPDSIRVMVRRAEAAGFNTLLVQVRGRGDAFHLGRWEPTSPLLSRHGGAFDPLQVVLDEAHARGLAVHAWVNTHLVSGVGPLPLDPDHVVNRRPDFLAVPRELARELYSMAPTDPAYAERLRTFAEERRQLLEGVFTSPAHPEVKEHVYSIWMDLVERYALDGIHFDYIRYPSRDFDYSRNTLHRFRRWVWSRLDPELARRLDDAFRTDPLAFADALPAEWDEFRQEQVTDLVERIFHGVRKRRPEALVSAAVVAEAEEARHHRFQDWTSWLTAGVVDVVVPMAYTTDDTVFVRQIREAVAHAGSGRRVWAGIGAYRNTLDGTLEKIRLARSIGVGGVALFSYDWAVGDGAVAAGGPYLDRVGQEAFGRGR